MRKSGPQTEDPQDASTLRIPVFPPRPSRGRRPRIVLTTAVVLLAAGTWAVTSRTQEAVWFLPATYVPDSASSTVTVLVKEFGCDGGAAPSITRPRVDLGEGTVTIAMRSRERLQLSDSCQEDPLTPVTVDLGEPLGNRTLVDAYGDPDDSSESVPQGALGPRAPAAAQR